MNAWLLFAMLAVIVTWVVLAAILMGVGIAVQRLFGTRTISAATLLISPWNGLAAIILFLQIWHFFLPIQWPALTTVSIIAAVGLVLARRELIDWARTTRIGWPLGISIAVLALWAANRAVGPGDATDSGIYHYTVIRWTHEHPIVPGLANLHPHFGFNNACHLFDAMLKVGPWQGRANHVANSSLLIIALATVAISAAALIRGRGCRAQNLFNVVLLIPLVMLGVSKEAASPTSDLPQAVLTFAAASTLFRLLSRDSADGPAAEAFLTLSVIFISAAALCVKLTAAATVVPLGMLALATYWWRAGSWRSRSCWKVAAWGSVLSVALAGTWLTRNVITSGCPLYPSRAFAMDVDWLVPRGWWGGIEGKLRQDGARVRVDMLRTAVASSAFQRVPSFITNPIRSILQDPDSTSAWLLAMTLAGTIEVALPVCIALIALTVAGSRTILYEYDEGESPPVRAAEWLILVAPLIGLVVWFVVSPEPRYAASSFWIMAAALVSMMFRETPRARRFVVATVVLALVPIGYRMMILAANPASGSPNTALFVSAGPDFGFHPIPTRELERTQLPSGLVLLTPPGGGPHWDAPLPSTGFWAVHLRLRRAGELRSGFVIDEPQK